MKQKMFTADRLPPGNGRNPNDFRVLFLYPNIQMCALMPTGVALLSAVLKREGFTVDLFDCTFYRNPLTSNYPFYHGNLRPVSWEERHVRFYDTDMIGDFQRKVDEFKPDLIAVSVVENTYFIGLRMIQALRERIPTVFGGVFATYAPDKILREDRIDFVCRGEGEEGLLELALRLCRGLPVEGIPNLWVKQEGRLTTAPMRAALNLDELPFPDFDLFEPQSIYRAMQGKVWRTLGIETQRGCPYTCAYCNSPSNNQSYSAEGSGRFYRKKSMPRVREELSYLVEKHQPELIYFVVDTFLAMGDAEFTELADMYMDFKIPFWMNTRAETITEHRAERLEEMNMLRMSMGIEHGNPEYREKFLRRKLTNERMLQAFQILAGRKYTAVGNSIIGMPEETRELIFDTIRFNRSLPKEIETTGAFIFAPYHGTPLREMAIQKGYLDPDSICSLNSPEGSMLDMPQLRRSEILGLERTFSFYVDFPESDWPAIREAEPLTPEGDEQFHWLQQRYLKEFFGAGHLTPIEA